MIIVNGPSQEVELNHYDSVNRILPAVEEPSSNDEYSMRRMSNRSQREPKKLQQYSSFRLAALALIVSIIACVVNLMLASDLTPMNTALYLHEHRNFVKDWKELPFISVELIKEGDDCSLGFEPLLKDQLPVLSTVCGKRGGKNFLEQVRV